MESLLSSFVYIEPEHGIFVKRLFIYLFFFACMLPAFGQNDYSYDKMESLAPVPETTTSKRRSKLKQTSVYDLIDRSKKKFKKSPEVAFDYLEEALSLSFQTNDKRAEAWCYYTLGELNFQLKRYAPAFENYKKAIPLFESEKDEGGLYFAYKRAGRALEANMELEKSLVYYMAFVEKARQRNELEDVIEVQNNIASIYFQLGEFAFALEYYSKTLELQKSIRDPKGLIQTNNEIGRIYTELNDSTQALKHFNNSEDIATKEGQEEELPVVYRNVGEVYNRYKDYDKGLSYQVKARDLSKEQGNKAELNVNNLDIANSLIEQNQMDLAIPYLKESMVIADEVENLEEKKEAFKSLSRVFEKKGDYTQALDNYKEYVALSDSIQREKDRELLAELKQNLELLPKEKSLEFLMRERALHEQRIELLMKERTLRESQLSEQRSITYALIGGLVVLLLSSLMLWRGSRQKRKANHLLSLRSLRSEMNPHFIFNSLNSVNNFISRNDDRSANKYLSNFSRLMRLVMENSRHDFVPLSSEIQALELYLELEHLRFSDKFEYSFSIDPALDRDAFQIPPMLIQPYIENAIWHGLRYKETKGDLKVEFSGVGNKLKVVIEDNGIGRKRSQELKTNHQKAHKSSGIKNIEERIAIFNSVYHTDMKVAIHDLAENGAASGTRVEIEIPGKMEDS